MQKIAARVGFSETAFVQKSAAADFKIRFFTPAAEVDLCGHATIAVFSLLFGLRRIRPGKHSQETRAGVLGVEVQEDGTVFMDQTLPLFGNAVDREDVAASLGIGLHSLAPDMPVQIVSTGLRDIIVPVISLPVLSSINPDLDKITEISQKQGAVGYHVFSLETKRQSTAHCRNLAPLYGIPEEAATGTSSGALACYLFKYGKITEEQAQRLVFEQGYAMRRPSEISSASISRTRTLRGFMWEGRRLRPKKRSCHSRCRSSGLARHRDALLHQHRDRSLEHPDRLLEIDFRFFLVIISPKRG